MLPNNLPIQLFNCSKLKKKFSIAHNPSKTSVSGQDLVVFEGKRLIIEALETGIEPETFVFSRLNLLPEFPLDKLQARLLYLFSCKCCELTLTHDVN